MSLVLGVATAPPTAAPVAPALPERSLRFRAMGGWVGLRVATPAGGERQAEADLAMVAARIHRWAARITRFDPSSELASLNREPTAASRSIGPSLGALLARAQSLSLATGGLVDVTLLAARLAAEQGVETGPSDGTWALAPARRGWQVSRRGRVAFDLDGVGKGWIADRALGLLRDYPQAMVDADGDVAVRTSEHSDWGVAIEDPRRSTSDLAMLARPAELGAGTYGIATSGTSVHRWHVGAGWAHHLIDPRTGRPAQTDVTQATVVAADALTAEALAKSVVIAGSDAGLRTLQRCEAHAAVLLLDDGQLVMPSGAEAWLA